MHSKNVSIERTLSRMTVADQSQIVPSVGTLSSSNDSQLSTGSCYSNASSSTGSSTTNSNVIDEPWHTNRSSCSTSSNASIDESELRNTFECSSVHGTPSSAVLPVVSHGLRSDYERTGKKYNTSRGAFSGASTPFTSARPVSPAARAKRQNQDHFGELLSTIAARLLNLELGLSTDTEYFKTAECEIANIGKMLGKGGRKGQEKNKTSRSAVEHVRQLPQFVDLNPNGDARRVLDELLARVEEKALGRNSTRVA